MLDPKQPVVGIPVAQQGIGEGERTRQYFGAELGTNDLLMGLKKEELMRLLQAGKKLAECARILGRSVQTIRRYCRGEVFQRELKAKDAALWARVDEELQISKLSLILRVSHESEKALERIAELIDSPDEKIALRAASDILDRNPEVSKRTSTTQSTVQFNIDPATLILAAQTAKELNGPVIEGTLTSTEPS